MIYTLNNIQFEVKNQQVQVAGQTIQLSPRGHHALLLFLASENQVLSKEFLLKTLWKNVIVSDDSLFKVVQEIRKALRLTGLNEELISNVYGKGYQLQASVSTATNKSFKPYLIWISSSILALTFIAYIYQQQLNHEPKFSNQEFDRQIELLESNLQPTTIHLNDLTVDHNSHPSDQLKLAYLYGLKKYKSGDYDHSIEHLMAGIQAYGNEPSSKIIGDTYLLLSRMYIYRSDKEALQRFLDQAELHFRAIDDQAGITSTAISRARYHQAVYQFPESIVILEDVLTKASHNNDVYNQMRAISNLAYSYQQSKQPIKYIQALEQTLSHALQISDGNYAAYAYGALSQIYMEQADFIKAMKFAQQALKFVLEQQDTNNFQQGYSAFYNLLQELGHNELAQTHLQSAIDIQAHFNNESLLVLAEINLAKVKMTVGDFVKSNEILKKLLATDLTPNEQLEVTALFALNSYFRQDNINAYTEAKRVYETIDVDDQTLLLAGSALVLSSHQLERDDEATKVFNKLKPLANQDWLFAYTQFLHLTQIVYSEITPNEDEFSFWSEAEINFQIKRQETINYTKPDNQLMTDLHTYVDRILNQ